MSIINALHFEDANLAHEGMCARLMLGLADRGDIDFAQGTEVGLHNVSIGIDSFGWEYDLKRLWLAESRWNTMVRQYLDGPSVDRWLESIDTRLKGKGRGIAVLRSNNVQGYGEGRAVRRRWGSCMLTFSYRAIPRPTVTMHSRTTYFGYLAAMDITVAHALAWEISERVGVPVEEMQFIWNIELAQFHGFRSLAWALGNEELRNRMDQDLPDRMSFSANLNTATGPIGYRKALDGYARLVRSDEQKILYGDESFSSFCRVRRRFHAECMPAGYGDQFAGGNRNGRGGVNPFKPLPSLMSSWLDLSPLPGGTVSPTINNTDCPDDEEDE